MKVSTSRIKKPIERRKAAFRDATLFFISTEGSKTEKQYFESILFGCCRVQIEVIPTPKKNNKSAPEYVLERLKERINELYKSDKLEQGDQFWLVVDKDRWPDKNIKQIAGKRLHQRPVNLALSNPCFELWLYLHNSDSLPAGHPTSKEMENILRGQLGCYHKNALDVSFFQGKVLAAAKNSRNLDLHPEYWWPACAGTHVYKLIEALANHNAVNE